MLVLVPAYVVMVSVDFRFYNEHRSMTCFFLVMNFLWNLFGFPLGTIENQ